MSSYKRTRSQLERRQLAELSKTWSESLDSIGYSCLTVLFQIQFLDFLDDKGVLLLVRCSKRNYLQLQSYVLKGAYGFRDLLPWLMRGYPSVSQCYDVASLLEWKVLVRSAPHLSRVGFSQYYTSHMFRTPGEKLRHVEFLRDVNPDALASLPASITTILFGAKSAYNRSLPTLPNGLRELRLPNDFDQPIDGILPESLEVLILRTHFNQSVNHLPSRLKYLELGCRFNQPVDHLPNRLIHLVIGLNTWGRFNQSLSHLPNSLKTLTLSLRDFNQDLDHLPSGLRQLHLERTWSLTRSIQHLPSGLKILSIQDTHHNSKTIVSNLRLPSSLTSIQFRLVASPTLTGSRRSTNFLYRISSMSI